RSRRRPAARRCPRYRREKLSQRQARGRVQGGVRGAAQVPRSHQDHRISRQEITRIAQSNESRGRSAVNWQNDPSILWSLLMPLRIADIRLGLDEPEEALPARFARILGIRPQEVLRWRILRKSLDARDKNALQFVYTTEVVLAEGEAAIAARAVRR